MNTCHSCTQKILDLIWSYFLANEIFIAFDCVILKPCRASRAAPACTSLSNSTKAMSWRPGTRRTSLKPGNLNATLRLDSVSTNKKTPMNFRAVTDWLNSMDSMSSFVSSGRLVRKRMWLGGFSETCEDKYQINTKHQSGLQCQFLRFCFSNDNKTTHLLRHLPRHHGTRRHLTRRHARGRHHTRRGHIRWLTWHVHHTRGLAHRRHSLGGERHHKCLASILMLTMRPLYSC